MGQSESKKKPENVPEEQTQEPTQTRARSGNVNRPINTNPVGALDPSSIGVKALADITKSVSERKKDEPLTIDLSCMVFFILFF